MSICVALNNGLLAQSTDNSCDYLLLTKVEAAQIINGQFDLSLLQFDSSMYQYFLTQMLVSFITGHVLGRILKHFGKI